MPRAAIGSAPVNSMLIVEAPASGIYFDYLITHDGLDLGEWGRYDICQG